MEKKDKDFLDEKKKYEMMKVRELEEQLVEEKKKRAKEDKHYLQQFDEMLKLKKQKEILDLKLPKPIHKSKSYQKKLNKRKKSRGKKAKRKKSAKKLKKNDNKVFMVSARKAVDTFRDSVISQRGGDRKSNPFVPETMRKMINRQQPILPDDFKNIPGGEDLTWNQKLDIMRAALGDKKMPDYLRNREMGSTAKKVRFNRESDYHDLRNSNGFIDANATRKIGYRTYNMKHLSSMEARKLKGTPKIKVKSIDKYYEDLKRKSLEKKRKEREDAKGLGQKPKVVYVNNPNQNQNLDAIEAQLQNIRDNLKPLINQFNREIPARNPHAELMEVACGRLMKVHSEKLIESIIEDLVEENVYYLNEMETEHQRNQQSSKIRGLCDEMAKAFGQMEMVQRQHYLDLRGLERMHKDISKNIPVKDRYKLIQHEDFMGLNEIQNEKRKAHFLADGPFTDKFRFEFQKQELKLRKSDEDRFRKNADDEKMLIVKDQTFRKKEYVDGVKVVTDKLMEELMIEVMEEFSRAQDVFVDTVIKAEFS